MREIKTLDLNMKTCAKKKEKEKKSVSNTQVSAIFINNRTLIEFNVFFFFYGRGIVAPYPNMNPCNHLSHVLVGEKVTNKLTLNISNPTAFLRFLISLWRRSCNKLITSLIIAHLTRRSLCRHTESRKNAQTPLAGFRGALPGLPHIEVL